MFLFKRHGLLLTPVLLLVSFLHHGDLAVEAVSPSGSSRNMQYYSEKQNGTRTIKIDGTDILRDGTPFHILSGSIHYFRMPAQYWRDRLRKLKIIGFNSVATYVEWSHHEPEKGHYRFEGDYDVKKFVEIAAEEGLLVLLRPGPYICAERDLGGLPYWLLSEYPNIKLRTADADFIRESRIWMNKLFSYLTPLLYENGGPIILVQVENEYGSFGSDMDYKIKVRDMIADHVRTKALLYTTDGFYQSMIEGGAVPDTFTTVDFGVNNDLQTVFAPLKRFKPNSPLMNSEFYPGWLTHWGENLQQVRSDSVVASLRAMLMNRINVNMYVFHGGTNFEFYSGANFDSSFYKPDITSYDYDAPLNEAGDPTPKYNAIRDMMAVLYPSLRGIPSPKPSRKGDYGRVQMTFKENLLSAEGRSKLGKQYAAVMGEILPTFESLRQRAGLVLFETQVPVEYNAVLLSISKPRDRIYVYIDGVYQGLIDRMTKAHDIIVSTRQNSTLSLLVENQGRINFGPYIKDLKGILSTVELDGSVLNAMWLITGFPLENVNIDSSLQNEQLPTSHGPILYEGRLELTTTDKPLDTFLDTTGWGKGYVWVNGHNLGRYWPSKGPQVTLYVPGVWLRADPGNSTNVIQVLELETPRRDFSVNFINYPILNGTYVGTGPSFY